MPSLNEGFLHTLARLGATMALLAFSTVTAQAQTVGVRAGASARPDQFYFGAHLETPPVADRLRFRPNVEIGVGNDLTVFAFNFEFAYHFESPSAWNVYVGGGPALNIIDRARRNDTEGGFNILVGVAHRDGFFVEIKGGMLDSPNFKFGVGYAF